MAMEGTYTFVVITDRGRMEDQIVLVTEGETLGGNFLAERHGGVVPLTNIKVNGDKVEWKMNVFLRSSESGGDEPPEGEQPSGGPPPDATRTEIAFKGTISGGKVSGKLYARGEPWEVTGERIS